MTRYTVVYGPTFLDAVRAAYPHSRSGEYEGPTFGEFMNLPVRAASLKFARDWDSLPSEGGPTRLVILPPSGPFGPVVVYAWLATRGSRAVVEIVGFEEDRDYWSTFIDPDDPDD